MGFNICIWTVKTFFENKGTYHMIDLVAMFQIRYYSFHERF